ncbi:MAG TPA: condensation domain-containing protein, partial [Thermoanaerobaculia bacterium]
MPRPTNFEDAYPLSPLQQGLLFHALYAPDEGVYIDQLSYLVDAPAGFDAEPLRRAFAEVVARHGALRTAFSWQRRDAPLQVVLRTVKLPFAEHDWRRLDPAAAQERLARLLAEDRRRGFDLAAAPLARINVCRLSERSFQLILTYHHVVLDGWSVLLIQEELFARIAAA